MDTLNPKNEAGRLTLIARFGAGKVGEHLPRLIRAVRGGGREGRLGLRPDARQHDQVGSSGYKTRPFDPVLREVREFFAVHNAEGTIPGGVHFEMTGQDVTECTGGVRAVTDEDLSRPLPHRLRPAPERQPVAGTGLPRGRGADRAPQRCGCRQRLIWAATCKTKPAPERGPVFLCLEPTCERFRPRRCPWQNLRATAGSAAHAPRLRCRISSPSGAARSSWRAALLPAFRAPSRSRGPSSGSNKGW